MPIQFIGFIRIAFFGGASVFVVLMNYFGKRDQNAHRALPKVAGEFTNYMPVSAFYLGVGLMVYLALLSFASLFVAMSLAPPPCGNPNASRVLFMTRTVMGGCGIVFAGLAAFSIRQKNAVRRLVLDHQGIHEFVPKREEHILWASIRDVEMDNAKRRIHLLLRDGKRRPLERYFDYPELVTQVARKVPLTGSGLELPVELGIRQFRLVLLFVFALLTAFVSFFVFKLFSSWGGPISETFSDILLIIFFAAVPTWYIFKAGGLRPQWIRVAAGSVELKSARREWLLSPDDILEVVLVSRDNRIAAEIHTSAGETLQASPGLDSVKLMRSIWLAQGSGS